MTKHVEAIGRLLAPDAKLLDVFWRNLPTPFEMSGEDDEAAKAFLRAIAEAIFDERANGS